MSRFFNKKFSSLKAYVPGEQPKDMKYLKLNTNESPYPPSPSVCKAVNCDEASLLKLYPDPDCTELKAAIADLYGMKTDNIFVSNGSDDILNFSFAAFSSKDKKAYFADITYGFYSVFAEYNGVEYVKIPLDGELSINVDDYINKDGLIVIANPNAPTGNFIPVSEIEKIVASNKNGVVVIDEAYVDFGGESCVGLVNKYDNLLVVQTFSKSRSMAGARLGFAVGNRELISDLETLKFSTNPYSINRITLKAGVEAIKENDYYTGNCKKIIEAREYTYNELTLLGFDVIKSYANFLFAKSSAISGERLYLLLKQNGILVRHFDAERIKEYNRITIGTMDDMCKFITAVKKILECEK